MPTYIIIVGKIRRDTKQGKCKGITAEEYKQTKFMFYSQTTTLHK